MTEMSVELIPEKELLAVLRWWRRVLVNTDGPDVQGHWGDAGNSPNSIVDAEALTCLLLPQATLPLFQLGNRTRVTPEVVQALRGSSGESSTELPEAEAMTICSLILEFFNTYQDDGVQVFAAGDYGYPVDKTDDDRVRARQIETVDSYTFSLTVCLYSLLLVANWRRGAPSKLKLARSLSDIERLAKARLTVVLQRLTRSFAVAPFGRTEWEEATGRQWPSDDSSRLELDDIREHLLALDASNPSGGGLIPLGYAFECGWSWGLLQPADVLGPERLPEEEESNTYRGGHFAQAAPYFYFTMTAVDGIADLNLEAIQAADLFDPQQLALVARLRQYLHLTARYWAALGFSSTSSGTWAIEDIPWRTSDGDESDYYTLYMLGAIVSGAATGERLSALELERVIPLVEELAQRSRVIRRPTQDDPALLLHSPGKRLALLDSNSDHPFTVAYWDVYDFAPQVLKLVGKLLALARSQTQGDRLRRLANGIWQHLAKRRAHPTQADGVLLSSWDEPARALRALQPRDLPYPDRQMKSWYITERTVEALTAMATAERTNVPPAPRTGEILQEVMSGIEFSMAVELPHVLPVSDPEYTEFGGRLRRIREEAYHSPSKALSHAWKLAGDVYKRLEVTNYE